MMTNVGVALMSHGIYGL